MATAAIVDYEDEAPSLGRKASSEHLDKVHAKAIASFDTLIEPLQEERALCLQDRRFVTIAGAQWEGEGWSDMSENMIRVEVNKTAAGLDRIMDDYRANRVMIDFRSVPGTGASEDTADILDGLFRADVYRSKGQQASDNAFFEGAAGGIGAWRLVNELEDQYDPENEHQRIAFKPIVDADQCVFFDPESKLYDKSDARYCFVLSAMGRAAFEEKYPGHAADWPSGIVKPHYDWFTPDVVIVAEYYEVEDKEEELRVFHLAIVDETEKHWASDLDDADVDDMLALGWVERPKAKRSRRRVHKYILSGTEVLKDCGYIAGTEIPVVMFFGKRSFIDNVERAQGHVRKAKDPQRIYNTQVAKMTEQSALAPREVPIFDPKQVAGLEQHWANQNIERHPYALAHALTDENGNVLQTGAMGKIEPPQLAPVQAALLQITAADIRELTNADDGADKVVANVSAEAMDIAATRVDEKSIAYMDNFRQSMQRCGEIYLSMAASVYVEEGRRVETLGEEGEQGEAVLLEPYTDEKGAFSIRNDLSKGKYKIVADVTEATSTRRDKTVKGCLGLAQMAKDAGDLEMAQASLITAAMNMDGDGMGDLQKWTRKRALGLGLVQPTDEEQAEIEAAAAQAGEQKDPQAEALQAMAAEAQAKAGKAEADTKLSEARVVSELADAAKTAAETGHTVAETQRMGLEAVNGGEVIQSSGGGGERPAPFAVPVPALDRRRPIIRMARDMAQ